MRLYHKCYRHKNPEQGRSLRGKKKEVHGLLLKVLKGGNGWRKNPRKPGGLIDAYNLLGKLNLYISQGHEDFIPLRDTVSARIDGYLSEDVLSYSLAEAMRDLSSAHVRVVQEMISDVGGEVSPDERRIIDEAAARDPAVQRAQYRVDSATRVSKAGDVFRDAISHGLLRDTEFLVGPERLAAMKEQQRGERSDLGTDTYRPYDDKLWKRVELALEKKYPERYVPPKQKSVERDELSRLVKMSHKNTTDREKDLIKKRIQTALRNRWRSKMILAYEAAGGRPMTRQEVKFREAQRMRKLGTPFPLGNGFFGVIYHTDDGKSEYSWKLLRGSTVYISGMSKAKNSASRDVGIAYRILMKLGESTVVGWDSISTNDRRWLETKQPNISRVVARLLMRSITPGNIDKGTAKWLASSASLPKFKPAKEDAIQTCSDMTLGEELVIEGEGRKYQIHVKKLSRGKFTFYVEASDGSRSVVRRGDDCGSIISRGHTIGGAMAGASEVTEAVANPDKIKSLDASARKYFRKNNPKMPRQAVEEGDIRELTGMMGVPDDPKEAYRYGYYAGIIRGIDTCGVQNYFKRRRIRDEFQSRLIDANMETTARLTGSRIGSVKVGRGRKKSSVSDGDIDSILADIGD